MPITKGFRQLVDEANAQITTYTVEQVRARLDQPLASLGPRSKARIGAMQRLAVVIAVGIAAWSAAHPFLATFGFNRESILKFTTECLAPTASITLLVGAGGGLPGMVLAISRPDMKVSMIDTVHKKTAFLNQVKAELGLSNVTVYTKRVEGLTGPGTQGLGFFTSAVSQLLRA